MFRLIKPSSGLFLDNIKNTKHHFRIFFTFSIQSWWWLEKPQNVACFILYVVHGDLRKYICIWNLNGDLSSRKNYRFLPYRNVRFGFYNSPSLLAFLTLFNSVHTSSDFYFSCSYVVYFHSFTLHIKNRKFNLCLLQIQIQKWK
jgi:hypothetical protein